MSNVTRKSLLLTIATFSLLTFANASFADRGPDRVFDHRYHHDHYYPARGLFFPSLPRAAVSVRFGGDPYYFHEGIWYRPYGPRFTVIAPPIGLIAPVLPPFYSTVWVRGVPYYYANDTYYVWEPRQNGYVVTRPPADAEVVEQPLASAAAAGRDRDQLYTYPKNGQSEQQQATDRFDCHSWAVNQTQYDPSQVSSELSTRERLDKRTEYTRAMTACLEGRGYSVK